jgi:hypothetical protein
MMSDPPADTTQAKDKRKIVWDDSNARKVYSNHSTVSATREEISLLFGTSQAGQGDENTVKVELTDGVAMSPYAAKRFAVQLDGALREYESKYGPLQGNSPSPPGPRPMRPYRPPPSPLRADEKAGVLFNLVENLKSEVGFEQSFKIVNAKLLEDRFLLGVSKKAIGQGADEQLAETCNLLGMPEPLFALFSRYLSRGNYVHFGFERNEQSVVYKVYLEFWEKIKEEIGKTNQRPGPALLHLGLKWDVSNPGRRAVTRYTWHPWLLPDEIEQRVLANLDPHTDAPPLQAAGELISLALARVSHRDILYLDVTEEGNPRRSFDINVYRANLQIQEIYPLLSMLCRRHAIPFDPFHSLYDRIKEKRLGHLAAGVDREGKDFFTIYYGVEGVFGERSQEPARDGSVCVSEKFAPPAKPQRLVRIEETDEKAGRLFQLVKSLGMGEAFERSFKFLDRSLLTGRFLTGFKRATTNAEQDEAILNICRQIGMPQDYQERFASQLHEANIVLFAFEENEKNRVYKTYLEFSGRLAEAAAQDPRPESVVSHTGFKWDVSDNSRKAMATYLAYPLFRTEKVATRVLDSFYGGAARKDPYSIVDDLLDLAGSRTHPGELLYFEVSEEGNPRNSFDINVYWANLRVTETYPMLVRMARHYSIDLGRFDELYEGVKDQKFGHLSGGTDREGRDFLTVYFSQKGSSRPSILFPERVPPSPAPLKGHG